MRTATVSSCRCVYICTYIAIIKDTAFKGKFFSFKDSILRKTFSFLTLEHQQNKKRSKVTTFPVIRAGDWKTDAVAVRDVAQKC